MHKASKRFRYGLAFMVGLFRCALSDAAIYAKLDRVEKADEDLLRQVEIHKHRQKFIVEQGLSLEWGKYCARNGLDRL